MQSAKCQTIAELVYVHKNDNVFLLDCNTSKVIVSMASKNLLSTQFAYYT